MARSNELGKIGYFLKTKRLLQTTVVYNNLFLCLLACRIRYSANRSPVRNLGTIPK